MKTTLLTIIPISQLLVFFQPISASHHPNEICVQKVTVSSIFKILHKVNNLISNIKIEKIEQIIALKRVCLFKEVVV